MANKLPKPLSEILSQLRKPASMKHKNYYVFVEGFDDVRIYREIARKKDMSSHFTFEQRGGRDTLLKNFTEISENHSPLSSSILFFADQDTYVFQGIPTEYSMINFSKGYSIENDLFEDGFNYLKHDLSASELEKFEKLIENISEWYAYEMSLVFEGKSTNSKIAIKLLNKQEVLASGSSELENSFLVQRGYVPADRNLVRQINDDFILLLRGKILFEILYRISDDREGGSLVFKDISQLWNACITEGMRNSSNSNTSRIAAIFSNHLSNFS